MVLVSENQLDAWVRSKKREAQGVVPELVYRLVAASCPAPRARRFPFGDSIGQAGRDGVLDTDQAFEPFVPRGKSVWEIGTGETGQRKANEDYNKATEETPAADRSQTTFIFVTPLSAVKGWEQAAQCKWTKTRAASQEWKDVRVLDGTCLIDWVRQFPAVEVWLASQIGVPCKELHPVGHRWEELRCIGDPPPLPAELFLANRDDAVVRLDELFGGKSNHLTMVTRYPGQVSDFVAAYVGSRDADASVDYAGRCVIVSGYDGLEFVVNTTLPHVLVLDFRPHDEGSAALRLIAKAQKNRHALIIEGLPGGVPDPCQTNLPNPKGWQVMHALVRAGYQEERARRLAERSDGHLGVLLRLIQNYSAVPEWAQANDAADLKIAMLLSAWDDKNEADREIVESLGGQPYGEWIDKIRDISQRLPAPLVQKDGRWRVKGQYEVWHNLAKFLSDDHLDRFQQVVVEVLRERDPKFDLARDIRYAANIMGKATRYSKLLRNGLAESLAIVGSCPDIFTSCSRAKAQSIAGFAVKELLADVDWIVWGSLNDCLPLLAEAAPWEFMSCVEIALDRQPSLFSELFAQEGDGITGSNYMTGLLWALETLAWSDVFLPRVAQILARLDVFDPGGRSGNRPLNSLSTIWLPWLPQTCATADDRLLIITQLQKQYPQTVWKLLKILLPQAHQVSMRSRRPAWREMIPEDWRERATTDEYTMQVLSYMKLAVSMAKRDVGCLVELLDRYSDLSRECRTEILTHVQSKEILALPLEARLTLWSKLHDVVNMHTKFSSAAWALDSDAVRELAEVTKCLGIDEPFYTHQRLFVERLYDLLEETGDYEEQCKRLEGRRAKAIREVFAAGGTEQLLAFAAAVASPWQVGWAAGAVSDMELPHELVQDLLESGDVKQVQMIGGYIRSRFFVYGWTWLDSLNLEGWAPVKAGKLLAYLPFTNSTWLRVEKLLGYQEQEYWLRASVSPYEVEGDITVAISRLFAHGRASDALQCICRALHKKSRIDTDLAAQALLAIAHSPQERIAIHETIDVIRALQSDPKVDVSTLAAIEWAYLPLLARNQASPVTLERELATNPRFFCQVIRTVYKSSLVKDEVVSTANGSAEEREAIAKQAYELLSSWRIPPGQTPSGFDGDALKFWLDSVKEECVQTGHLKSALQTVGQVMIYAPKDPGGLWIHKAAAAVLNEDNATELRQGFLLGTVNSRGVYRGSKGREELELASSFRARGDELKAQGYFHFAETLVRVAQSYESEAQWAMEEDEEDF